jgi:hypothetical protein
MSENKTIPASDAELPLWAMTAWQGTKSILPWLRREELVARSMYGASHDYSWRSGSLVISRPETTMGYVAFADDALCQELALELRSESGLGGLGFLE